MKIVIPLCVVLALIALAYVGVNDAGLYSLFGCIIPYIAFVLFVLGFVTKIFSWARSPVPFRIPTTVGQQASLPWFKQATLDNPSTFVGVVGRMLLEVLCFRSLFGNTKAELSGKDAGLAYGSAKLLWLAAMLFHWSFLVILVRHSRFFLDPIPLWLSMLEFGDGLLQITVPVFYLSGAALLAAAGYLLFRRMAFPKIKYISQPADYFPLFLILAIAITGLLMRYFIRVDIVGIKAFVRGLVTFNLSEMPEGIGVIFYIHLFLVSALFAYFPFSKLMHMGGVFLSPTRNLANNSRARRHINPWNPDVKFRTYEEYENEFRAKMKSAGLPVEKN